jgi:hypothetical protein
MGRVQNIAGVLLAAIVLACAVGILLVLLLGIPLFSYWWIVIVVLAGSLAGAALLIWPDADTPSLIAVAVVGVAILALLTLLWLVSGLVFGSSV